jgi:2-polyprenyl-3-methyl-5-hydroxy-6-metoxy-1,4-benzoquinol methylase
MSERQMATTMADVRDDHRARYQFAIKELQKRCKTRFVFDAGCGVGYGSDMLAEAINSITSIKISEEAFNLYSNHWQRRNIDFQNVDLLTYQVDHKADAVVGFEFIENVEFYAAAIEKFAEWTDLRIISAPIEEVRPLLQDPVNPHHFRHFRPDELRDVPAAHGFEVVYWNCQRKGSKPENCKGTAGKFIIAVHTKTSQQL